MNDRWDRPRARFGGGRAVDGRHPPETAATPDPALALLDRLAGTWDSPGTFVNSAYSKAGTARATTTCAWSDDRFLLICSKAS